MEKINLKADGEAREMRNDAKLWYDEYTKMYAKYKTACQAIRAITDAAIAISNPYKSEV